MSTLYDEKKLTGDFSAWLETCGNIIREKLGDAKSIKVIEECISDFRLIIPKIPWLGGDENPNTFFLLGGVYSMGLIKPLERAGLKPRDIGHIIYKMSQASFLLDKENMEQQGKGMVSPEAIAAMRQGALWSQKRACPDDFVLEFVEPQGNMLYGINITECAVMKFYKAQNLEKYVKYCCLVDYPMYQAYNICLDRKQTLGNGGSCCDFMFLESGETPDGWPPETRPEFKGDD